MFIYGSCSSVEPWRAREQSEATLLVVVDHTHRTADFRQMRLRVHCLKYGIGLSISTRDPNPNPDPKTTLHPNPIPKP